MRAALYARYSSDLQNPTSIEDQLRLCRERAAQLGATVVREYTDAALSGATMNRPGLQDLRGAVERRQFDVLIVEAIDRLSRNAGDTHKLFDRLKHAGVRLVTLADGTVTRMHVAFKGLMAAEFLDDLAAKVRRGMIGRVSAGFAAGPRSYGYDVVRRFGADGQPVRGLRAINAAEAEIVQRIFREYVAGRTTRQIAADLNRDDVPGPRGRGWSYGTIRGTRKLTNGILSNPLYIGQLCYNKQAFAKDPDTGRKTGRANARKDWIVTERPELRIVPQDLWEAAQAMQAQRAAPRRLHERRAPRKLLSGLLVCAACGGHYQIVGGQNLGCGNAHRKRTCSNRRMIRLHRLEARVFDALRDKILEGDLFEDFARRYREIWRARAARADRTRSERDRRLKDLDARIGRLAQALEDGGDLEELRRRLAELSAERTRLRRDAATADRAPSVVELHPRLAERYRQKVEVLAQALKADADPLRKARAAADLRTIVDRVVLHPGRKPGQMRIELHGYVPAILDFAAGTGATPKDDAARHSTHSPRAGLGRSG